ncbi:MAG: hypothetical protein Q9226_007987 [Calogaya cf. arnoldii]
MARPRFRPLLSKSNAHTPSSLGLLRVYMYAICRIEHRTPTSTGAVEGIIAAAVPYTSAVLVTKCPLRKKKQLSFLRWLLITLDLAFTVAFLVVVILTRPERGPTGNKGSRFCVKMTERNRWCKILLATFNLVILSMCPPLLHSYPR